MTFPDHIIHAAADCTVRQFKDCAFREKYYVLLIKEAVCGEVDPSLLKKAFEYIYAEYVDYSHLYQVREFELSGYIHSLDNRIQTIRRFIELQRKFIIEFGVPFIPGFGLVKRYGHTFFWDFDHPDKDAFLQKLAAIELKEKRYETEITKKINELVDMRKKKIHKEHTILESRKQFITMCNRLQQAGFVIDQDKTTVEDLALMIKDQRDAQEAEQMNRKNR